MTDWKQRAKATSIPSNQDSDWKARIKAQSIPASNFMEDQGPQSYQIDDSEDAPALVRAEVGSLSKPEDRLTALRKTFPDAIPDPEDPENNFIYTDEKGVSRRYNTPNWNPFNSGDLASIAPEAGETVGGGLGGIIGALLGAGGGAAAGTVAAPGPGTVGGAGYGGLMGALAGAGLGSAAGREGTMAGMNYLFGNEDTRTAKETAIDVAQTAALGAAGEGVGRVVLPAIGRTAAKFIPGTDAYKHSIMGATSDPAKSLELAEQWRGIGVEPTPGMVVKGNDRLPKLEHALTSTKNGQQIQSRIDDAFAGQQNEFSRIVTGISDKPLSIAEAGEALQRQAALAKKAAKTERDGLYDQVGAKVTTPATVDNTAKFMSDLHAQRASMGKFDLKNKAEQSDEALEQAAAIIEDASGGKWSFTQLKQARTTIGKRAEDETDPVLQSHLKGLYDSLTADMEKTASASGDDALQTWKQANQTHADYSSKDKGFAKGGDAYALLNKNTDDIFNYTMNGAKNGGNRLAQVRRIIERGDGGKDAWDQSVAGFVKRLGSRELDGAEVYDPTLFMNQWKGKISKEAKDVLFAGTKGAQYRKDLDTLSNLADNFKTYKSHANHSNTQAHKSALESMDPLNKDNMLGTALGLAGATVTGVGVPAAAGAIAARAGASGLKAGARNITAGSRVKLLTNPATVNWITQIPKASMAKGGTKAHIKKLLDIRQYADNATAAAINEYLRDLNYRDEQ